MEPRTILITGASGKLGRALTSFFLANGDRVIATCRTTDSLKELQHRHDSFAEKFLGFELDLTNSEAIEALLAQLDAKDLLPDGLVNSARHTGFLKIEEDGRVSRENFANEYLLDVIVPYELTMALALQKTSQLRRVVNIGSMYGTVAANPHLYTDPANQSPLHYGVAKAALEQLTRELAVRLASRDIQVNCVAFGGVEGRVDDAF